MRIIKELIYGYILNKNLISMLLRLCKTYELRIVPMKWWNIKCLKWVVDETGLCGLNKNILQPNRLHII